jgi:hypothetical protein
MIAMTIPFLTGANFETTNAPWCWGENPELGLYRRRTVALLRRYLRLSLQTGRVASLLGRESFRTRVTSYHITSFVDVIIFVHDVERCLEQLDEFAQQIIAHCVTGIHPRSERAAPAVQPATTGADVPGGARSSERHFPGRGHHEANFEGGGKILSRG